MAYGLGPYGVRAYGRSIRLSSITFPGIAQGLLVPSRRISNKLPILPQSNVALSALRVRLNGFSTSGTLTMQMNGERLRPSVLPVFIAVSSVTFSAERVIFNGMNLTDKSTMSISGRGIYAPADGERPVWVEVPDNRDIWSPVTADNTDWTETPFNV